MEKDLNGFSSINNAMSLEFQNIPDPKIVLQDGTSIPQMAFGMYKVDIDSCERIVLDALNAGYRHFDTATFYGNEAALGKALKKSGLDRKELYITTKVWNDAQKEGPGAVRASFEKSLVSLDCGYIDLFLVHWPVPGHHINTYKEMEQLKLEGKIKSIGLSNYNEDDYQQLVDAGITVPPQVNQIEVSPVMYRPERVNFFISKGIAISAYKAINRGLSFDCFPIIEISKKYSVTQAQVMLRWGLQKGLIIVAKTSSIDRMNENRSLLTFSLNQEDLALLDSITTKATIENTEVSEKEKKISF